MALERLGTLHRELVDTRAPSELGPEAEDAAPERVLFYQDRGQLPVVDRGEGIYIWDEDGRRYLDGCSGAIVANLGHGNRRIIEAAVRQLEKIAFAYRTQFQNQPANELAELLARLSPPGLDRVFFVNSGSEAVEASVKLARQFWWARGHHGKGLVMSRRPSYHGATLGALSLTDYAPLKVPFRPMLTYSPKVSAPYCYHCPLGKTYPSCELACAWELQTQIDMHGADNVAAFMTESIGGSSTGAAVPPDEYFPIIEKICHDNGVLLIIDDVMAGCGRTGTFYSYEHWGIAPDIVVTSKGLSSGYAPIGAIVAGAGIVDPVLESGGFAHGHTYAGNPLSAAITLEAIKTVIDEDLVWNARKIGTYLHERLHALKEEYSVIGDVRGRGLLAAIELVRDRLRREPFPADWQVARALTEIAREEGLLIYPRRSIYGLRGDHCMIAPPLTITEEQVDELIFLLARALDRLSSQLAVDEQAAALDDKTVQRYAQADQVAAYAVGQLAGVEPADDANITSSMQNDLIDLLPVEDAGEGEGEDETEPAQQAEQAEGGRRDEGEQP
jgi:adenosylmethionine-8-amino-7-oxononanoate aminotransferase